MKIQDQEISIKLQDDGTFKVSIDGEEAVYTQADLRILADRNGSEAWVWAYRQAVSMSGKTTQADVEVLMLTSIVDSMMELTGATP